MSYSGIVKVLLVDDLANNLLALEGLLRRDDLEIITVKSGTEALGLMIRNEFAVALIDVEMPGMSGFELAEFMRGAKRTKEIPIIFVTATATDQSFAFKGYESGGVDYLVKPLDSHTLKSKVNVFIELYQQKKALRNQLEEIAEMQEALKQAKDEAERANASKTEFLANMSHEIRTPIAAMIGFAELLQEPDISADERASSINTIIRNGHHLTRLINEILDLSKIEAGKLETENRDVSLPILLGEVTDHLGRRAAAKGLALRVITTEKVPERVLTDPTRLHQILNNIIGNAIKYTAQGEVVVTVDCRAAVAQEPALVVFSIKDSGIGIEAESIERLFKPFSQADSSTTRKFGGTGLGLALSRKLAVALGGNVELETSTSSGSVFVVTVALLLPSAQLSPGTSEPAAPTTVESAPRIDGLKILLAEDAPDNRLLLTWILTKQGCTVEVATNGYEAVELATSADFDLILMDIQMPELDGFGALALLRRAGYNKPVLALTAHAMNSDLDRCLAAGFDGHMSKPINRGELIATLARLGTKGRTPPDEGEIRRPKVHFPPFSPVNMTSRKTKSGSPSATL